MNYAFVDTLYWVALSLPGDPWYKPSIAAFDLLKNVKLVTTEEVLAEYLTAMASSSDFYRSSAAAAVRDLLADPSIIVVPSGHKNFLNGLTLYEQRSDKRYSLIDCISMNVCRTMAIERVLTNDRHFEQEGFQVLIRR